MLYCRRISPGLNSGHQVVVGRLGSLGRAGMSRLAVNERLQQYQKQQDFAKQQQQLAVGRHNENSSSKCDEAERTIAASGSDSAPDSNPAPEPTKPVAQRSTTKHCRKADLSETLLRDPDLSESSRDSISGSDDVTFADSSTALRKSHPD